MSTSNNCYFFLLILRIALSTLNHKTDISRFSICMLFFVLAEFIIDIADKNPTFDNFKRALVENGAEFSDSFMTNLLRIIQHMKPVNNAAQTSDPKNEAQNPLANKFPGLAIPNKKPPVFSSDEESESEEKSKKNVRLTSKEIFKNESRSKSNDEVVDQAMAELEALAPSSGSLVKNEHIKKGSEHTETVKKRERSHSRDAKDNIKKREHSRDRKRRSKSKDSKSRIRNRRSRSRDRRSRSRDHRSRSRDRRSRSPDHSSRNRDRGDHDRLKNDKDRKKVEKYRERGDKDRDIRGRDRGDRERKQRSRSRHRSREKDRYKRSRSREKRSLSREKDRESKYGNYGKKSRKKSPEVDMSDDPEPGKVS